MVCLLLKGCRTAILLPDAGPLGLADSLALELGPHLVGLGAVGLVLTAWRSRGAEVAVQMAVSAVGLVLILLECIAVFFAADTGGALDHHLFRHALGNALALLPVIASEVTPSQSISVVSIAVALVGGRLWYILRRPIGPVRARSAMATLAIGALLIGVGPLRIPPGAAAPMALEIGLGPLLRPPDAARGDALTRPPFDATGTLRPTGSGTPPFDHLVVVALESTSRAATSLAPGGPDTTPTLAALAADGASFDRAYVVVPHSSKAVVAMNCGVTPFLLMEVREALPGGLPVRCLPDLLREQGFQTLYFGSHVGDFENWFLLMRALGFGYTTTAERLDTEGFERVNYFSVEDDALLEPTRAWLRRARGKRLFAFYLTSAAHHDYRIPKRHYPLRDFAADDRRNRYLNAVFLQDAFLARLMRVYQEEGYAERTLFVVVGDHGEAFGEHGRTLHDHVPYEEGIHVPLVLHGRGLEPMTSDAPVSHLDLLPTVTRLLGFRIEGGSYEGQDLFARDADSVVYASCWYSERCLARVGQRRKIISHFRHQPPEAFDLERDPGETHDVFGDEPGDADDLADLHRWKDQALGRYLEFYGR